MGFLWDIYNSIGHKDFQIIKNTVHRLYFQNSLRQMKENP